MPFTTFNDMLRRTAWRLPDKTFLYWTDKNRSLTYAEGERAAALGAADSPAEIDIIAEMPMTATGKIGKAELKRRELAKV